MSIHDKLLKIMRIPVLLEKAQKYYQIVFLKGKEAKEALKLMEAEGEGAAIRLLSDYDYGKEMDHTPMEQPWGPDDDTFDKDPYMLTYNTKLGYISLLRKVGEEAPEETKEERVDMTGRMMTDSKR